MLTYCELYVEAHCPFSLYQEAVVAGRELNLNPSKENLPFASVCQNFELTTNWSRNDSARKFITEINPIFLKPNIDDMYGLWQEVLRPDPETIVQMRFWNRLI